MVNKLLVSGLVLLLVLGGWLGWYFSDKQVVKRLGIGMSWDISKEGRESTVQTALKMREIKNVLAADCTVIIPERSYRESVDRDMIISYLVYHRQRYSLITVTFADMWVDIPAKGKAVVQLRAHLLRQQGQAEPVEESGDVEIVFKKENREWLLSSVTVPVKLVE